MVISFDWRCRRSCIGKKPWYSSSRNSSYTYFSPINFSPIYFSSWNSSSRNSSYTLFSPRNFSPKNSSCTEFSPKNSSPKNSSCTYFLPIYFFPQKFFNQKPFLHILFTQCPSFSNFLYLVGPSICPLTKPRKPQITEPRGNQYPPSLFCHLVYKLPTKPYFA